MDRYRFKKDFVLNMEAEREALGLTQVQMAEKLEMSTSSYKKLVAGDTSKIDIYTAFLLYQLTGKYTFEFVDDYTSREKDLIKKIHSLGEQQLIYLNAIAELECVFKRENADSDDYITVFVPTGNMMDGMIYDSAAVEKLNISDYRKRFGNKIHYGMKITSNHLHPVYNKGDILLICKEPIRDGDTGIFFNKEDGCVYIRKFHQTDPCLLEPITDYGMPFTVDSYSKAEMDKWVKFGYVLTKVR